MTALDLIKELHAVCQFQTREGRKVGKASNRELERWFQNRAVILDGVPVAKGHHVTFPVQSLVLFPKHTITLWQA